MDGTNPEIPTATGPVQSAPTSECDLVMKGGVTSGIVYPRAILKLKDTYRFRSIGGTSAGAIAAGFSAAAEYGRETGGFERLVTINQKLGQEGFLLNLFQPSAGTKPLMDLALGFMKWNAKRQKDRKAGSPQPLWKLALSAIRIFDRAITGSFLRPLFFCSLFVSIGLILTLNLTDSLTTTSGMIGVLLGVLSGMVVGVISSGLRLWKLLFEDLPANQFGICTGMKGHTPPKQEALIDFLHDSIQTLAGRSKEGEPLTFEDLTTKAAPAANSSPGLGSDWSITLNVMTTNLSQNQPYILPFSGRTFLFKESQFKKYFPDRLIAYLRQFTTEDQKRRLPQDYFLLPDGDKLPILVAVRMSLSFPLLFCAVPLYTFKRKGGGKSFLKGGGTVADEDLQENWFSDGGITSNFPIHFFDAWLPSRPTFGISLSEAPTSLEDTGEGSQRVPAGAIVEDRETPLLADGEDIEPDPDEEAKNEATVEEAITIQKANAPMAPLWYPFFEMTSKGKQNSLTAFLASIFTTAQNHRDTMQAMLPSYRERIVNIRLGKGEGGLNLGMDRETIQKLMKLGDQAADKLQTQFRFSQHQWVRLRVLGDILEEQLSKAGTAFTTRKFNYQQLLNEQSQSKEYPYRKKQTWCTNAETRLKKMEDLIKAWDPEIFNKRAPSPRSILRVSPRV